MAMNDVPPGACGGFEKLTVSTAVVAFTASNYSGRNVSASKAKIFCQTAAIYCRWDGTDPDSSTGFIMAANQILDLDHPDDIKRFRAIRLGGSDGVLHAHFHR